MTTTPRCTCVIDRELDAAPPDDVPPLTAIELEAEIAMSVAVLDIDPLTVDGWESVRTAAAEACIARFAAAEADLTSPALSGPGRTSGVRFPRLGGVLHGRVAPDSGRAALLRSAVERTIRAGYHTALSMEQVSKVPVLHHDADGLWSAFVPDSYRLPRRVAATTWEVCRFDDLWTDVLEELGLDGDAVRFAKGHVSALSRSIRGLSTVGLMLALAERGGRHDRLQSARVRPMRARRRGRGVAPAPRPTFTR
jgi:hypothetical protein